MPPTGSFGGFQAQQPPTSTIDESTPWIAAADGDLSLLQTSLAQLGISPDTSDSNGCTCLHTSSGYGRVEVMQWLIGLNITELVVNVNARDGDGDTPLHHCEDVVSAKLLVAGGADPLIRNADGKTALEVKEGELEDGQDGEEDSEDEDRVKLTELVTYLRSLPVVT